MLSKAALLTLWMNRITSNLLLLKLAISVKRKGREQTQEGLHSKEHQRRDVQDVVDAQNISLLRDVEHVQHNDRNRKDNRPQQRHWLLNLVSIRCCISFRGTFNNQ